MIWQEGETMDTPMAVEYSVHAPTLPIVSTVKTSPIPPTTTQPVSVANVPQRPTSAAMSRHNHSLYVIIVPSAEIVGPSVAEAVLEAGPSAAATAVAVAVISAEDADYVS